MTPGTAVQKQTSVWRRFYLGIAQTARSRSGIALWLFLLTCVAVLVQGYHLGTDDGAIYIPAIKSVFDPQLYPFGAEFFLTHQNLSIYSYLVGDSARLLHLPVDLTVFLWYVTGVFLLLFAGWRIASVCFTTAQARWSAVTLLAMLLAVPVAGTALVISDPYFTAHTLSNPAVMLTIAYFLEGRKKSAAAWLLIATLIHAQMAAFGLLFLLFLMAPSRWFSGPDAARAAALPMLASLPNAMPKGFNLHPAHGTYREVLYMRTFFFVSEWRWYEWFGAIAPLAILFWLTRIRPRAALPAFQRVSRTLIPFALFSTAVAILFSSTDRLESFVRLQPMRAFHLLYVIFFLLLGGLLGEYILQRRVWRWLAFFVPLAIGMYYVGWSAYPTSRHIEWPGAQPKNQWVAAFDWIRDNTPENAVFALDPNYMLLHGEDLHGFRAIAERSQLADYAKDSGVVSLFPDLTENWERQQQAQRGWKHFQLGDFERLARQYPVSWVVLQQRSSHAGLACPYANSQVLVCRIPGAPGE